MLGFTVIPGQCFLSVVDIETIERYLPFLAAFSSLGKPCLAMNARAFSTFLIIKGELLTSDRLGITVIPAECFIDLDIQYELIQIYEFIF